MQSKATIISQNLRYLLKIKKYKQFGELKNFINSRILRTIWNEKSALQKE